MLTKSEFMKHAAALLDFCEYPAVQYKVRFSFLDTPYQALQQKQRGCIRKK